MIHLGALLKRKLSRIKNADNNISKAARRNVGTSANTAAIAAVSCCLSHEEAI